MVLGVVVVLLGAVVVDSCVESPPQLAKAMMAARAANVRIQWTRTVKAPKGGSDRGRSRRLRKAVRAHMHLIIGHVPHHRAVQRILVVPGC